MTEPDWDHNPSVVCSFFSLAFIRSLCVCPFASRMDSPERDKSQTQDALRRGLNKRKMMRG